MHLPPAAGRIRLALSQARRKTGALVGRLVLRFVPTERQRMLALTLVIGAACGLAAVAFHSAIRFAERRMIGRVEALGKGAWPWLIAVPMLGGLAGGLLLQYVFPQARGSGIPQVKVAYARLGPPLGWRDVVGKFLVGVIQIGSGASLGREGPTVQICAGLATLLGRATGISRENVRRLLPVGAAAGVAAAFNAPVAAVTFAIEEIVGNLDQTLLSGVVVAAALAAAIERGITGGHPVFDVPTSDGLVSAGSLFVYAVLGMGAAAVSIAFTDSLLGLRKWFRTRAPVPPWAAPGIGAAATGAIAAALFVGLGTAGITGGGYETLHEALTGHIAVGVLLVLCAGKVAATVFSYSSGGAGGIFAPSLFIGGMLGGAIGHLDVRLLHHEPGVVGAFALVGMGAAFAGIVRAPITSVLIIFEMTGNYGLILPLMIANMTSYGLARRLRPEPIYEALLHQDSIFIPRDRALGDIPVSEVMSSPVETLSAGARFDEVLDRIRETTHGAYPVLDDAGRLVGLLTLEDVRPYLGDPELARVTVAADLCRLHPPVALPTDSMESAVSRFVDEDVEHLLVVLPDDATRVIGMLSRRDVLHAYGMQARRNID